MADDLGKQEAPASDTPVEDLNTVSTSTETESGAGAKIDDLSALGDAMGNEKPVDPSGPVEPKLDKQGRAYATGKRKNAVARVWIKPGSGVVMVNGREIDRYFARPVLRMVIDQPFQAAARHK